jgi:hypothetical protein
MKMSFLPSSDSDLPPSKEENLKLSWQKFLSLFPTEQHRLAEIFKRLNDDGELRCKKCLGKNLNMDIGDRSGDCRDCYTTTWFTSGTFFDGMKKVTAWLGCIWLMEQKVDFNAPDLARLAGVANSTAWEIHKRVTIVANSCMQAEDIAISVSSAHFLCAIWRRTLKTPADEHPIAEQDEIEKGELKSPNFDQNSTTQTQATTAASQSTEPATCLPSQLCGTAKILYECLSDDPVHFDMLCQQTPEPVQKVSSILVMMQLDGLVVHLPGDLYIRSSDASPPAKPKIQPGIELLACDIRSGLEIDIASFIKFIRKDFQGISRKYLQLYLAAHWCYVDGVRWPTGSLLHACRRFRAITYNDIRAYVSPLFVKVMPC